MSEIKDGGPAFPSHGSMGEVVQEGMTLRDYFAAKALPTLISLCISDAREEGDTYEEHVANATYDFADAMLRARGQL